MKKPLYLFDKNDPWMLAEDIPDSDIFFFQIPMSCFVSDTSYPFIRNYKKVLTHYKRFDMDFYFGKKDSLEVGESILHTMIARPSFGRDLNKNIVKWSYKLIDFAKQAARLPYKKFTNQQLWQVYADHDRVHTKLYTYGWLPVAVDMFHNNFTKRMKQYLYTVCESKEEAEEAFVALTTPSKKTIVAKEREEFLEVYTKYRKVLYRPPAHLLKVLEKHKERWGHLGYIYAGNTAPFASDYYLKELQDLAKSGVNAGQLLANEVRQLKRAKIRKAELYARLKISPLYKRLFNTGVDFALTKLIRRHAQLFDLLQLHQSLLPEIAKRLSLTRYQVQFMLKDEVRAALLYGKVDKNLLRKRLRECVLYTEKNFEAVYVGVAMKKIAKNLNNLIDFDSKELTGQTARPGFARGIVKIIIRAKDMAKMNPGDILVSIATDPDIVQIGRAHV